MGAGESVHADQSYGSSQQSSPNKAKLPQLTPSKLQQKADNEREQRYLALKKSLDKNGRPKMHKKYSKDIPNDTVQTQSKPKADHEGSHIFQTK